MNTLKYALRLTLATLSIATAATATPQAIDGPTGGHILTSELTGATSPTAAFKAGIHQLRGAFDGSPKLLSAIKSQDGNVTIVAFSAVQKGMPVSGLSVSTYDPAGHSRSALLYDTPAHFTTSLPSMLKSLDANARAMLEKSRPASSGPNFAAYQAASKHVSLTRAPFPDHTATIGIAAGFKPMNMQVGQFAASSADGAYCNLNAPVGIIDPGGSIYRNEAHFHPGQPVHVPGQIVMSYNTDPFAVWKEVLTQRSSERGTPDPNPQLLSSSPLPGPADGFTKKMVAGTMTANGEPFVFTGVLVVGSPPPAIGNWYFQINMCAAPLAHASADMPALLAMQHSERIDMKAFTAQSNANLAAALNAMNAASSQWLAASKAAGDAQRDRAFESSMHNAQVAQDGIDRSAAGFIHYIKGNAVVAHDPTGAHGTLDSGVANALVTADPQHFHVVPLSQYVKGQDY